MSKNLSINVDTILTLSAGSKIIIKKVSALILNGKTYTEIFYADLINKNGVEKESHIHKYSIIGDDGIFYTDINMDKKGFGIFTKIPKAYHFGLGYGEYVHFVPLKNGCGLVVDACLDSPDKYDYFIGQVMSKDNVPRQVSELPYFDFKTCSLYFNNFELLDYVFKKEFNYSI